MASDTVTIYQFVGDPSYHEFVNSQSVSIDCRASTIKLLVGRTWVLPFSSLICSLDQPHTWLVNGAGDRKPHHHHTLYL